MDKRFNGQVRGVAALARSRRRRDAGLGGVAGSGTGVAGGGSGTGVGGTGHSHRNMESLERFVVDELGYGCVTSEVTVRDEESGDEVVQLVTERMKVGFADLAWDLSEGSPAERRFLSSVEDDVAVGLISFANGIRIGEVEIWWDGGRGCLRIGGDVAASGEVTAALRD